MLRRDGAAESVAEAQEAGADGWLDGIGPKDGRHDGISLDKGMKDESVLWSTT